MRGDPRQGLPADIAVCGPSVRAGVPVVLAGHHFTLTSIPLKKKIMGGIKKRVGELLLAFPIEKKWRQLLLAFL